MGFILQVKCELPPKGQLHDNCLCWWHHSCLEDMRTKSINLPQLVQAIWIWQLPPVKFFTETPSILERFLEIPFQAPNMLQFSGNKLLINENFNSPALIVKNTAIILLEFTTTSAFYIHWCIKGWQFYACPTPKEPVLNNSCWNWVWSLDKFKSRFKISNNQVIIPVWAVCMLR